MIIDTFLFFNELDILELRLKELENVVDKFVLVEAAFTFSGKPKPLYYAENMDRFARWKNQIYHYVLLECPQEDDYDWGREYYSRNAIARAVRPFLDKHPIIMLSDVDEIPRPIAVGGAFNNLERDDVITFDQTMYYYYLNLKGNLTWHGTRMFSSNMLERKSPQELRHFTDPTNILYRSGWHFSHCNGGINKIKEKLFAGSHQEYNKPEFTDTSKISERVFSGKDLYGRNIEWNWVDIDDTYPATIRNDLFRWRNYIHAGDNNIGGT